MNATKPYSIDIRSDKGGHRLILSRGTEIVRHHTIAPDDDKTSIGDVVREWARKSPYNGPRILSAEREQLARDAQVRLADLRRHLAVAT